MLIFFQGDIFVFFKEEGVFDHWEFDERGHFFTRKIIPGVTKRIVVIIWGKGFSTKANSEDAVTLYKKSTLMQRCSAKVFGWEDPESEIQEKIYGNRRHNSKVFYKNFFVKCLLLRNR
uniref:Uncharacterized protein n=1 Tax=Romanomermis culicivorax TaxID=13658 RepID=A0A915KSN8_ROMCU